MLARTRLSLSLSRSVSEFTQCFCLTFFHLTLAVYNRIFILKTICSNALMSSPLFRLKILFACLYCSVLRVHFEISFQVDSLTHFSNKKFTDQLHSKRLSRFCHVYRFYRYKWIFSFVLSLLSCWCCYCCCCYCYCCRCCFYYCIYIQRAILQTVKNDLICRANSLQ